MQLSQLLTTVEIAHFGQTFDVALNWIGELIKGLINGVGIVGVGVILFSVILKLVVLPFDIFQRISMRKQNIKMKENQERMEKLQKQYANNKDLYNQKVMEMYKESGISMFSSCLPMILSMVIFFVAIGAFNSYSQYANIHNYNLLVNAYNEKIEDFAPEQATEDNIRIENGTIIIEEAEKPVRIEISVSAENEANAVEYANSVLKYEQRNEDGTVVLAKYIADVEKTIVMYPQLDVDGDDTDSVRIFFQNQARSAVVAAYDTPERKQNTEFLWIKNVWATDAAYVHPVLGYSEFTAQLSSRSDKFSVNGSEVDFSNITKFTTAYKETSYEEVTRGLTAQKNEEPNGYFILIALSIGTILLQQFVSMRSQKEQQKYSSVDGQGASSQKTTMVIMTIMFAVFSFMYSAAFSIYMITSNIVSLLSTLIINKLVDISMSKKEAKALQEKYNRTLPGQTAPTAQKGKKNKK
ncbi:MAG: YidC/Oxa1 family membrane protein insertase [Clostridia bacterium]|nr:YidC/Oxa1 family membrane protein insertase [Clostridia bacterium]